MHLCRLSVLDDEMDNMEISADEKDESDKGEDKSDSSESVKKPIKKGWCNLAILAKVCL